MKASSSLKGGFYLVTMATGRESHPHPSLSLYRDTKGKGDQREAGGVAGAGGGHLGLNRYTMQSFFSFSFQISANVDFPKNSVFILKLYYLNSGFLCGPE